MFNIFIQNTHDFKEFVQNLARCANLKCANLSACEIQCCANLNALKVIKYFNDNILNIRIIYTTTKISDLCSVKDKIPEEQKCDVIYNIKCPGCGENYIGKTDCCFGTRMHEQGNKPDEHMFSHYENVKNSII